MKIGVFGAGGIGAYFGGRLAHAGADVHLIARGRHLAALRNGLAIRSPRGDLDLVLPATADPADIGPCDVVLLCVKTYDTESAMDQMEPLLHDDTAVVSLQNGIGSEDVIAARIGGRHVMGGAAFIFASVAEPGVIVDAGGPGSLVFGELDGSRSRRGERLLESCQAAGIAAEFVPDIRVRLWDKFAFICAQAGMTAATRLPIGPIRETDESWAMFRDIVDEVVALARAEGVDLPDDTAQRIAVVAQAIEPTGLSSLHHDLVAGRRMELESLHGEVVRRSRAHGLDAPRSEAVYALLRPHALRAERPA
jgi:2-dehydropantoate 2-reductase